MSTQFEVPGDKPRPAPVSFAAYAQFAVGGVAVVWAIVNILQTTALSSALPRELAVADVPADQADAMVSLTVVFSIIMVVAVLLFAVTVSIMGIFNLKGKNGTRITTWVLAGLGLLCGVCGSVGGAANLATGGSVGTSGSGDGGLNGAMLRAAESVPGWYNTVLLLLAILNVVLYLAIIILLAVPVSNDFFRKPKPTVDVMLPPEAYVDEPPADDSPKDDPRPPQP